MLKSFINRFNIWDSVIARIVILSFLNYFEQRTVRFKIENLKKKNMKPRDHYEDNNDENKDD